MDITPFPDFISISLFSLRSPLNLREKNPIRFISKSPRRFSDDMWIDFQILNVERVGYSKGTLRFDPFVLNGVEYNTYKLMTTKVKKSYNGVTLRKIVQDLVSDIFGRKIRNLGSLDNTDKRYVSFYDQTIFDILMYLGIKFTVRKGKFVVLSEDYWRKIATHTILYKSMYGLSNIPSVDPNEEMYECTFSDRRFQPLEKIRLPKQEGNVIFNEDKNLIITHVNHSRKKDGSIETKIMGIVKEKFPYVLSDNFMEKYWYIPSVKRFKHYSAIMNVVSTHYPTFVGKYQRNDGKIKIYTKSDDPEYSEFALKIQPYIGKSGYIKVPQDEDSYTLLIKDKETGKTYALGQVDEIPYSENAITIEHENIKLGENATKGVARKDDLIIINDSTSPAAYKILNAMAASSALVFPPNMLGKIYSSSKKVKCE